MNMIDDIGDKVKGFIFGIALKKGIVSAAKLIVSYAVAHGLKIAFSIQGIDVDLQSEAAMTVALNSALTMLRNYLKQKFPNKLGWL